MFSAVLASNCSLSSSCCMPGQELWALLSVSCGLSCQLGHPPPHAWPRGAHGKPIMAAIVANSPLEQALVSLVCGFSAVPFDTCLVDRLWSPCPVSGQSSGCKLYRHTNFCLPHGLEELCSQGQVVSVTSWFGVD